MSDLIYPYYVLIASPILLVLSLSILYVEEFRNPISRNVRLFLNFVRRFVWLGYVFLYWSCWETFWAPEVNMFYAFMMVTSSLLIMATILSALQLPRHQPFWGNQWNITSKYVLRFIKSSERLQKLPLSILIIFDALWLQLPWQIISFTSTCLVWHYSHKYNWEIAHETEGMKVFFILVFAGAVAIYFAKPDDQVAEKDKGKMVGDDWGLDLNESTWDAAFKQDDPFKKFKYKK